jgi:hypothetical protein
LEVLFLYSRLFNTAQKQLESLKKADFQTLEVFTQEREEITNALCESFERENIAESKKTFPESVQNKIHELTAQTLDIDAEIKEVLLDELRKRTQELSNI